MKGLSIEEKAKAYDEAIERAKNFIENGDERERTIAESIFAGIMEESEDERIRKALIRFHKSTIDVDGIKGEDIIAWLEKQGEHANFRNKIQIGDKVTRNKDGVLVNLSQLKRVAKKDAKQGEQEPDDKVKRKGMNLVEEEMTPFQKKVFCIIDTTIEEEQGLKQVCDELLRLAHDEIMQKSAWSEEDESMLQNILECLKNGWRKLPTDILKYESWLKSLRPQNRWKPSDEQMKALGKVLKYLVNAKGETVDGLKELEGQLKKLKE